jgi:hypothetical protein
MACDACTPLILAALCYGNGLGTDIQHQAATLEIGEL